MALTVSINHPAFPEGTEFGIDFVGVVPNGGSVEVTEENEQRFASANGMTIEDALQGDEILSVSGSSSAEVVVEPSPTPTPEETQTPPGEGEVS